MWSVFNLFFGFIVCMTLLFCLLVGLFLFIWIILGLDFANETLKMSDFSDFVGVTGTVFERLTGVFLLICLVYTVFSLMEKLR